jgi:cytochrome P450
MKEIGKQDVFADRIDLFQHCPKAGKILSHLRGGGDEVHGLIGSNGKTWREQRRFALRHLKDFGFGKSSMEELIQDELKELIQVINTSIKEAENGELKIHQIFNLPVLNGLWKIITGKRLDIKNENEKQKMADLAEMFASFGITGLITMVAFQLPFWMATKIPVLKRNRALFLSLFNWFRSEYDEHEKDWDGNNLRDFLDVYIGERKKANERNDTESTFYGQIGDLNFVNSLFDLFLAGSETTSTTLTYAILFMLHNPEPFKKAQAELDQVVGRSRLPILNDKTQLPYFEALLAEIMRCSNVAPFAVSHAVHAEATIAGYKLVHIFNPPGPWTRHWKYHLFFDIISYHIICQKNDIISFISYR